MVEESIYSKITFGFRNIEKCMHKTTKRDETKRAEPTKLMNKCGKKGEEKYKRDKKKSFGRKD